MSFASGALVGTANVFTLLSGTVGSSVDIAYAQLEIGTVSTSYIPTAATPVTRPAVACSIYLPVTEAARRASLMGRIAGHGNLSRAFFIAQAAGFGYPGCTVTELGPMTCADPCDGAVNGPEFIGVWTLNVPVSTAVVTMTCESPCDAALASWGNTQLECMVTRRKPAHTQVFFTYAP